MPRTAGMTVKVGWHNISGANSRIKGFAIALFGIRRHLFC
jgi:hypothetical protein